MVALAPQAPKQVLITRRMAADMLSVHERTIQNMQNRGDLSLVKVGKSARCVLAEIEAFGRPQA